MNSSYLSWRRAFRTRPRICKIWSKWARKHLRPKTRLREISPLTCLSLKRCPNALKLFSKLLPLKKSLNLRKQKMQKWDRLWKQSRRRPVSLNSEKSCKRWKDTLRPFSNWQRCRRPSRINWWAICRRETLSTSRSAGRQRSSTRKSMSC